MEPEEKGEKKEIGAPMRVDYRSPHLGEKQFQRISEMVYRLCGLNLSVGKEGLVKTRLSKRLRALGMASFDDYLRYVEGDRTGQEVVEMIDALTTNKTGFFREPDHFEYLQRVILPAVTGRPRGVRVWSAGCSTGEEPYSIALVLCETLGEADRREARILATDISTRVLATARAAVYDEEAIRDVPKGMRLRYFTCVRVDPPRAYRVNDEVRALVYLARLNLMDDWPMRGPFHVIFCRNVMIYFDKPTQQRLLQRFWDLLEPGGHLLVGHSESLTALEHRFRYVRPAVYVK